MFKQKKKDNQKKSWLLLLLSFLGARAIIKRKGLDK